MGKIVDMLMTEMQEEEAVWTEQRDKLQRRFDMAINVADRHLDENLEAAKKYADIAESFLNEVLVLTKKHEHFLHKWTELLTMASIVDVEFKIFNEENKGA